jgi:hypothetical protein
MPPADAPPGRGGWVVVEGRRLLQVAADRGELHPDAASDEGTALLSFLVTGVMSQQLANQPGPPRTKGASPA